MKQQKEVLFLLVLLFIGVVGWVAFSLYHTWQTSTISNDLQVQIEPIPANFDTAVIQKLQQRTQITPADTIQGQVAAPSSSTPASSEAIITPTTIVPKTVSTKASSVASSTATVSGSTSGTLRP